MGRLESAKPVRLRRMASAMVLMASSWPTTRLCSSVSKLSNFSRSLCIIRVTGIPVHLLTTSAICSLPTCSFSLFGLKLVAFNVLYLSLNGFNQRFFVLPTGFHLIALLVELTNFHVELLQFIMVVFAFYGFALYFQLAYLTLNFVQLLRHRVYLHTQFCGSFINQVNGLVGEKTVGNVTI